MAITQGTLGAGRPGLRKLFAIEAEKTEKQYIDIVGRVDKTTLTSEIYKQFIGLGPAVQTPEGAKADFDDLNPLYVAYFKPLLYTKGVKFSIQTGYTDQYGVFKNLTPRIARSFVHRRNLNVADLDNSGFTTTTYGMNSETVYSASHNMGSSYGYNRPLAAGQAAGTGATTLDLAFSPLSLEQAFIDIRKQTDARGMPMLSVGKLDVKVPRELYPQAVRALTALMLPGTNNNDPNFNKDKFNPPTLIDYYTSATAWFVKASDPTYHGLFFLEQMGYDVKELPMDEELMTKWVGFESWTYGWFDWHGCWGTLGA